ncbi:hypothetical protein ACXWOE_10000, partial [Streptococcus pyogenes]
DMQVVDGKITANAKRFGFQSESDTVQIGLITPLTTKETELTQVYHPFEVKMPSLGSSAAYSILVGDARPFLKVVDNHD